jgi:hypothetical protein
MSQGTTGRIRDVPDLEDGSSTSPDQMLQDDTSLVDQLPERDGNSHEEDQVSDIGSSTDGFDLYGDVLDAHKCCKYCTHCRVCFNLDYNLFSLNGIHKGEREIQSSLPDVATSAKNGCQICSLLDSGIRIAFSADKTGNALRNIQGARLNIRVRRGHSVNLQFWIGDGPVLELEYYTIAGTTPT